MAKRKLQEGKQREGARKDVARPINEPALEPNIPFVGPKDCFQWVLALGVVTLVISRGNAQLWQAQAGPRHIIL